MPMLRTILILGGTAEAYELAALLATRPGWRVITSLAGRTAAPRRPAGELWIGGFGGAEGLSGALAAHHVDAVVDATHPFAARMGWNAAQSCAALGLALLRLERPAWVAGADDRWQLVDDWPEAVAALARQSRRVLVTIGRQELAPFCGLDQIWFLIRTVEPPQPLPPFVHAELLLRRGPFALADELALLKRQAIDTILCKNSGGPADAKLEAARRLGLQVVMKRRPPRPDTASVATVAQAIDWLHQRIGGETNDMKAAPQI